MTTTKNIIDQINFVADKCKDAGKLDPFYKHAAFSIYEFAEALTVKYESQLNNDFTTLTFEERKSIKVFIAHFSASYGILDFDDIMQNQALWVTE